MDIFKILSIALGAVLTNNFVFAQLLGVCPFVGASRKVETAAGMGMSVTLVMGAASAVTWLVNEYVLVKFDLLYLRTVVFVLIIAALVQLLEMLLQKWMPELHRALDIYLPLITANCAVLGVTVLNVAQSYSLLESVFHGVTGGLGFLLAIVLLAAIRERLAFSDAPETWKGLPLALVSAGLMVLAFMGFSGLRIW